MSESNKDVLRRYMDAFNEGAGDQLDGLVSPSYVHHSNDQELDLAGFKRGAGAMWRTMPDLHVEIADMVSEGGKVAVRYVIRGTHLGSLLGEAPTSRAIVLYGTTIYRLEDGVIAEDWEALDEGELLKQIGVAGGS
jgi:steroid delta-isomerase-like uncharacterized protein